MSDASVARLLGGAQLWRLPPASDGTSGSAGHGPVLVAGWEDGHAFCAAVCTTDVGLRFCRRCPLPVAECALDRGRAAAGTCAAGVRLLAFPAPRGSRTQVAVLRVAAPAPRRAAAVAGPTALRPDTLRDAARRSPAPDARAALRAARVLRRPDGLHDWWVRQRDLAADRRRAATAALAQVITTSEEAHELHRAAQRQRRELVRTERRLDRLARDIVTAADVERARIAHDIHDTAAQSLVAAFRLLDAARTTAGRSDPGLARSLEDAEARVRSAIRETRAVLAELLPPGLEELGMSVAIARRLDALTRGTGIAASVDGELPRLADWVERAVYGMVSEAMSNAVRHSGGTTIRVTLGTRRRRAAVLVTDDGHGFDLGSVGRRSGDGLGLLGISRRARWIGGSARIETGPGRGTRVRISIPLEHAQAEGGPA